MSKTLTYLVLFLMLSIISFFYLGGKITDRKMNHVIDLKDYPISDRAEKLHSNLMVADLHADNLLWDRDMAEENQYGMVDLSKLIAGNYAIQVFDAVIKSPKNLNYQSNNDDSDNITLLAAANRWPIRSWFSLYQRALYQSQILHAVSTNTTRLEIIRTQSDLAYFISQRKGNSFKIGGVLSIEGLHALEGDFDHLNGLFDAGYRIMGLVHFFDNEVGGSSAGQQQHGLTDFGKKIIREMEKKQIIIDLAHASSALITDVLAQASRPVIVSHTGVKGTFDSPRNLSDQQFIAIGENGGLVGIGFWEEAVGSIHPAAIAAAIKYTANLIGVAHVALGSDFDGGVTTSFDASKMIFLTEALIQEGFSDNEINQIMSGNEIEFLKQNLPN